MTPPSFLSKIPWDRLGALVTRILDASDLSRDDIQRAALLILARGGDEEDVAAALEDLYERAMDWEELVPGLVGRVLEAADDPVNRVAARRSARAICKLWHKLKDDERTAWLAEVFPAASAA